MNTRNSNSNCSGSSNDVNHQCGNYAQLEDYLRSISWVWQNWLPAGMVTMLGAPVGSGKSYLAMRLVQTITLGNCWPDGSEYNEEIGEVLWIETEAAQVINLERARLLDVPLNMIRTPLNNAAIDIRLDNEEHWTAVRQAANLDQIKMVIVDSYRGSFSGDENSSTAIETIMNLASLARDTNKPFLVTHHLRKQNSRESSPVNLTDEFRGSSAIMQPVRLAWMLRDASPNYPSIKRLEVAKSNISGRFEPLGVTIDDEGLEFCDLPDDPQQESQFERAVNIIRSRLSSGPVLTTEMERIMVEESISWRTAQTAKLHLRVKKHITEEGWWWDPPN